MKNFKTVVQGVLVAAVPFSARPVETYRTALIKLFVNDRGQDFIEYALMAAFVATCAATISPTVASGATVMFSKVTSAMTVAGS